MSDINGSGTTDDDKDSDEEDIMGDNIIIICSNPGWYVCLDGV